MSDRDPWLTHFGNQLDARLEDVARGADAIHSQLAAIAADGAKQGFSDGTIRAAMATAMCFTSADKPTMAEALAVYALRAHQQEASRG